MKTVGEVAKLAGISKRTLHYYDEIGLLPIKNRSEGNYREYSDEDLSLLMEIMFYREVGFDLQSIKDMVNTPGINKKKVLKDQKKLLLLKKKRLDGLLTLIDQRIKGEKIMSFNEFDEKEIESYKKEAKAKWGHTKEYKESVDKDKAFGERDKEKIRNEEREIFNSFYQLGDQGVHTNEAIKLVIRWKEHISKYYYTCTNEIINQLADMYIKDERFTTSLDKYGKGTAQRMHDAIKYFVSQK